MKILTALNNEKIHSKLKKELKDYEILKDIIYKEGIIEFLTKESDINILILNNNIDGKTDIYTLVKQVLEINKYIEIIVILVEDDLKIRSFLSSYNINKVLIEGKFVFEDLLLHITNDNTINQKVLEKEIEELRKLIFKNEQNTLINKIKGKIESKIERKRKWKENNKNREEFKQKKKRKTKKDKKSTKEREDGKIYFTLSEELQKYNISSIDITINIKK